MTNKTGPRDHRTPRGWSGFAALVRGYAMVGAESALGVLPPDEKAQLTITAAAQRYPGQRIDMPGRNIRYSATEAGVSGAP